MVEEEYDYIVVGAGTAGSVVAGRLSENGKYRICVLEAGPTDRNPFIHIPAGVLYTLRNPKINWMYKGVASPGLNGRAINHARGKTLGGSGSINGHIYNRGQAADFDSWADMGNPGWSYRDVLPWFIKSENMLGAGDDGYHGTSGPFTITDIEQKDPLCDAFIESAEAVGIPKNPDYNGASQDGIAYAQRSVHQGKRVSPARVFLYPAMKRGNTRVITNAHVHKIDLSGNRADGVTYSLAGAPSQKISIKARREVILCAGAIASPQILQLSGIGEHSQLQALGLPTVIDLPGVGQNLRDHYAVRSVVRIKNINTINERVRGLSLLREVAKYGLLRSGALALTPTLVYAFCKSNSQLSNGDIQLTFTPASYPDGVQSGLDKFPGATIACWQHRPVSSGYVRAVSADPFEYPEIQGNYLAVQEDRDVLVAAMRIARQVTHSKPFSDYVENEIWPGAERQSDEELLDHAMQTGNTAYHPVGTCQMGPATNKAAVVDEKLRVHGVKGLRIADASVMPMILSANVNAGTLMIGERAADFLLSGSDQDN